MKEVRYFYVPDAATAGELPAEEATHAVRVLRLKAGDTIYLMDGRGTFHEAEVTLSTQKHCMYKICRSMPQEKTWSGHICVAMAPTKMMDRTEWFVEKATEIGIDEIVFLQCDYSERKSLRVDRVEKIVVAAMKQSRKPWLTQVSELTKCSDFLNTERQGLKFIAHCYDEIESVDLFDTLQEHRSEGQDITILIGPEGDFSIDEVRLAISKGYTPVSLGKSRLRTETAALYAATVAQLAQRK